MIDLNDLDRVILNKGKLPFKSVAAPRNEDGQINPHVTRFFFLDGDIVDIFHVKPVYYLHKNDEWRPLSEVTSHHGNQTIILNENWKSIDHGFLIYLQRRQRQLGSELLIDYGPLSFGLQPRHMAFASTLTVYPLPGTTVDGSVYLTGTGGTGQTNWSNSRNASGSGATPDYNTNTGYSYVALNDSGYNRCDIARYFALFDTSALTSGATISAATLSLYQQNVNVCGTNTGSNAALFAVASNPASNTALVGLDYSTIGFTAYSAGQASLYSGSTGSYYALTLNSTGMAALNKTGISKLGAITGWDLNNTVPPTTTNYGGGQDQAAIYYATNPGTTNDPVLVVTYTVASGGFFAVAR